MTNDTQRRKADKLLSLHHSSSLLVLPNIWNPIGARILQKKGYPALATASAAISASLGFNDGEQIRRSTLIDIVTQICSSVDIPVSVDIESGFADSISELENTTRLVVDSGAVGINIEDSLTDGGKLRSIEEQCERISTVRKTASDMEVPLVINARVDCFVSGPVVSREQRIKHTVTRAMAYSNAGADCIYPMGPGDRSTISALRDGISGPINILASPGAESLAEIKRLGVNRVSFGPFIFRSCLRKFEKIADELKNLGRYDCFADDMLDGEETRVYLRQASSQEGGQETIG